MKYLLFISLLLVLFSCNKKEKIQPKEIKTESSFYTIINIEGCEYIQVSYEEYNSGKYGGGWYVKYSLTHKGNCSNSIHHEKDN